MRVRLSFIFLLILVIFAWGLKQLHRKTKDIMYIIINFFPQKSELKIIGGQTVKDL